MAWLSKRLLNDPRQEEDHGIWDDCCKQTYLARLEVMLGRSDLTTWLLGHATYLAWASW